MMTAATAVLVLSVLLGGASRQNELRVAVVELVALPLLLLGLTALIRSGRAGAHSFSLAILTGVAALPVLQLVPLPPAFWTSLPGRSELVLALELTGTIPQWSTLSLTPDRTWQSGLALLPPLAIFVGTLALSPHARQLEARFVIGAAIASMMLGTLQLASGGDQFYLWPTTNLGTVVGFFANRNHLATLCLVAMPFVGMLAGRAVRRGQKTGNQLTLWLMILLFVGLIISLVVIRSRAGIALLCPVLVASLIVGWVGSGRARPNPVMLVLCGGTAAVGVIVAALALGPVVSRFDSGGLKEGRFENWPIVAAAAESYLPLGSGLGSFDSVYRSVEPLQRLDATFFNQAHNDYLEVWLEAGWLGAALIILFLIWFGKRTWAAWRGSSSPGRDLQRAASVAILAVLAHSAVDYPLRTVTVMTIFSMCCALLEFAGHPDEENDLRERRRSRRGSRGEA